MLYQAELPKITGAIVAPIAAPPKMPQSCLVILQPDMLVRVILAVAAMIKNLRMIASPKSN
jgi:hypothetical protein